MTSPRSIRWSRWLALSCALTLVGCSGPQVTEPPPTATPAPVPVAPLGGAPIAPPLAYQQPASAIPNPVPQAPPPAGYQPDGSQLDAPGQPPINLGAIQNGCPPSIPAQQADQFLRPLNQGPLVSAPPGNFAFDPTGGCVAGAIPELVDYGVFAHLRYYPFQSVWVPYILVDDFYYPYVFAPRFSTRWLGYCYYPILVLSAGCYYPYFFYNTLGGFGYPDWEYNWPTFRSRHGDYDWDAIGKRDDRRYGQEDFQRWRSGRSPRDHRADAPYQDLPRRSGKDRAPDDSRTGAGRTGPAREHPAGRPNEGGQTPSAKPDRGGQPHREARTNDQGQHAKGNRQADQGQRVKGDRQTDQAQRAKGDRQPDPNQGKPDRRGRHTSGQDDLDTDQED